MLWEELERLLAEAVLIAVASNSAAVAAVKPSFANVLMRMPFRISSATTLTQWAIQAHRGLAEAVLGAR